MSEHRRQILQMLAEGKISADEAERLITAFESPAAGASEPAISAGKARAKYLRVQVDSEDDGGHDGPTKVNVRVPMQLLRAGVKLTGVIPDRAREQVNEAMQKEGIHFDINKLTPDNLEELIEQLRDLSVDVDNASAKVRVFCE